MVTMPFALRFSTLLIASSLAAGAALAETSSKSSSSSSKPAAKAEATQDKTASAPKRLKPGKPKLDHSGEPRHGKASYYADFFAGRKMADGTPMDPNSNIAASRTLPIGTKAEVKNLDNGKTEVVEIRDRGPYIDGRIVDLTPQTAKKLDMDEKGVVPVVVTPIEVPQPDGSIKPGAAADRDIKTAER
ncbi:septal ring lytic transglycosylase RlpA family protein [Noviherbaspirillum aerium]|uniref:septal ring lytic transglycosylase RlpA family protein n=1 Tax=Noviherbaspirillum aerium TaxID=2588497 RepID=UPI001CEF7E01|nr:septal ring lytic transglycosylase RlpA family protein [Noviherbaspirillum aerium]